LAAVYSRKIDNKIINIHPSGWTYDAGEGKGKSLFVLRDKETGSLWYPFPGDSGLRGIQGTYKDSLLKEHQIMSPKNWSTWKANNPASKFVSEY